MRWKNYVNRIRTKNAEEKSDVTQQRHLLDVLQNLLTHSNLSRLFQALQRKIRIPVWTRINWGSAGISLIKTHSKI